MKTLILMAAVVAASSIVTTAHAAKTTKKECRLEYRNGPKTEASKQAFSSCMGEATAPSWHDSQVPLT